MRGFRDLAVWGKAHVSTLAVYRGTSDFPAAEMYGLTSQMRRAAASVPANIAEGCGRNGGADFARFILIALGSASELEYHILLARDLGYLNVACHETMQVDTVEVKKMLTSLLQKLRADH